MQLFPLDENGDVLRRMFEAGDNLTVPRDIEFTVVVLDERAADALADSLRSWGFQVTFDRSGVVSSHPWDVKVINHMFPKHDAITQFEMRLAEIALRHGGRNDGWICQHQN